MTARMAIQAKAPSRTRASALDVRERAPEGNARIGRQAAVQ